MGKGKTGKRRQVVKVDMSVVIENLFGEKMEEGMRKSPKDPMTYKPLTLGIVCTRALTEVIEKERLNGTQKYENYKLAMKIEEFKEVNLSAEEVSNLKKRIADMYPPVIMGRAWDLLDPKNEEPEEDK